MNTIHLLLVLIVAIVSIINLKNYYSKKRDQQKTSRKKVKTLISERTLSAPEAAALSKLTKRPFSPGQNISRIEGEYESNSLEIQGNTSEKIVTIGGILLDYNDRLDSHLLEWNSLEIVDPSHKKGAAILSMNGSYSAVEEAEIRSAMEKGSPYQKKDTEQEETNAPEKAFEFHQGRDLHKEERDYLKTDFRPWPSIISALLMVLAVLLPYLPAKIVLGLPALLLITYYILPQERRGRDKAFQKKVLHLSGTLEIHGETYKIGRFQLYFPKAWGVSLQDGQKIYLEAYPLDEHATRLQVLSLNGLYSLRKEAKKNILQKKDRFLSLGIGSALAVFLLLIPMGKIPYKIGQIVHYATSRGMQEEFDSFKEFRDYPFKQGQSLRLKNIAIMSADEYDKTGGYLVAEGPYRSPDFSLVRERLRMLDGMQMTEEMFGLSALRLSKETSIRSFYIEFYPFDREDGLPLLNTYASYYADSQYFGVISELAEYLLEQEGEDWPPFPEGGELKKYFDTLSLSSPELTIQTLQREIGTLYNRFLWEQGNILNEEINKEYASYLNEENALFLDTDTDGKRADLYFSDRELERFHSSIFHMGSNRYEQTMADPIEGIKALEDYETRLKNSHRASDIRGIIMGIQRDEKGIQAITLRDISNDRIPLYLGDLVLFLVLLAFLIFAVYMWLKLNTVKTDSSPLK